MDFKRLMKKASRNRSFYIKNCNVFFEITVTHESCFCMCTVQGTYVGCSKLYIPSTINT